MSAWMSPIPAAAWPRRPGKIFDPFFTTNFTDRGWGLAAVHGIVRGHKGAIRVSSEHGKETSYQVLFPAIADASLSIVIQSVGEPV
jgi:nitrogen-specific signal transduction histidine kinase